MEISPIPGIRAMPTIKPGPVDPELTALFDIESAARAGDDTYTGNSKEAAGAEENDEEEAEDPEEISENGPSTESRSEQSPGLVNFFA